MKTILVIASVLLTSTFVKAQVNPNNHYNSGYINSNGTYTQPHYKTNPNSTINDNYSTYPNYNPYTGEQGRVKPQNDYYSTPSYSTPSYNNSYPSYNYSTPSYDNNRTIYTGPRGGQYYYNSNGNKTYIKPD